MKYLIIAILSVSYFSVNAQVFKTPAVVNLSKDNGLGINAATIDLTNQKIHLAKLFESNWSHDILKASEINGRYTIIAEDKGGQKIGYYAIVNGSEITEISQFDIVTNRIEFKISK